MSAFDFFDHTICPQMFEVVVRTRLALHDMYEHRTVIQCYPLGIIFAYMRQRVNMRHGANMVIHLGSNSCHLRIAVALATCVLLLPCAMIIYSTGASLIFLRSICTIRSPLRLRIPSIISSNSFFVVTSFAMFCMLVLGEISQLWLIH